MRSGKRRENLVWLTQQLPWEVRQAVALLSDKDAAAAARDYLDANEEDRAAMLAFVTGGGPEKAREIRDKFENGGAEAVDSPRSPR